MSIGGATDQPAAAKSEVNPATPERFAKSKGSQEVESKTQAKPTLQAMQAQATQMQQEAAATAAGVAAIQQRMEEMMSMMARSAERPLAGGERPSTTPRGDTAQGSHP